ncbi:MAG TPA: bifunctional helix-turn-helix transcriptional regulator/GNAT family N-acetyltransferase [Thermoanaerobaculia bacterium]|nr:bifunctional helix-turn-helix transcriptional regulator/GNAT family N-acetyltransferase [Thermoanaerobaculia bacterium]
MSNDPIPTVRSFYRALTLRVGVFTDRFLGRGRPIAESRLIFEIGREGAEVRELRSRLNLDSGYLSRLLRSLERQGLVQVAALESDLRSRRACLTAAGLAELAELDRLGDRFAEGTLEPLSEAERARLVEAMSDVEKLLNLSFTRISVEDPDSPDAKWCIGQYFAELGVRFEGGFNAGRSIPADARDLRPPRGTFLVARLDGRLVGCGAVKATEPGIGSIKRMWVSREVRGTGVGRRLLLALEKEAAGLGMRLLRLETNRSLHEAQALYRRNGYREVPAFNDDPYADHWFEKHIGPSNT